MDEKDVRDMLWKLYQEHYAHIRHYESQRSAVTNLRDWRRWVARLNRPRSGYSRDAKILSPASR
jgi:hypothetical protein